MQKIRISADKEYDTLRQEILKRIEINYQIVNVLLSISAAFLGFGINNNLIALLLPPIILLLAVVWRQNLDVNGKISKYLSDRYEHDESGVIWETHIRDLRTAQRKTLTGIFFTIGTPGVFMLLSLIAMTLGLINCKFALIEDALIIIDIICIIILSLIFLFYRKTSK